MRADGEIEGNLKRLEGNERERELDRERDREKEGERES